MKKGLSAVIIITLLSGACSVAAGPPVYATSGAMVREGERYRKLDEALYELVFKNRPETQVRSFHQKVFEFSPPIGGGDGADLVVCTEDEGWPYISNTHIVHFAAAEDDPESVVLLEMVLSYLTPDKKSDVCYKAKTSKFHSAVEANRKHGFIQKLVSENQENAD